MKRGRRRHSRAPTPLASSALMPLASHPIAGTGSVTLNGNGKVTGGVIRCNQDRPVQHAHYRRLLHNQFRRYGVHCDHDLRLPVCDASLTVWTWSIAVSQPGGVQFQFSSDGNIVNSPTGY